MRISGAGWTAVAAALLAACGGGSSGEGGYDATDLGSYQDYTVTPAGGSPFASRHQIVARSGSGFTRKIFPNGGTGYTLNALSLAAGGEYVSSTAFHAADGTLQSSATFAPPFLLLGADTSPGASETTVSSVTGSSTYTLTRTVTVNGTEQITVPAGTFTALKTTAHLQPTTGVETYSVAWWVQGIGRVKMASYPASDPGLVSSWDLTGHGVAPVP